MLVDPGTTPAPEIQTAIDSLEPRRAFIRVYQDRAANVRDVSAMMEHFPYDLLIIATHCGDSDGYRWTYEFTDSEGLQRTLVVDLAIGFARTDDPDIFKVGQYQQRKSTRILTTIAVGTSSYAGVDPLGAYTSQRRRYDLRFRC